MHYIKIGYFFDFFTLQFLFCIGLIKLMKMGVYKILHQFGIIDVKFVSIFIPN